MKSLRSFGIASLTAAGLWFCAPAAPLQAAESLAIVADPGRFGDIERAASAEREVDWWDDDSTDDAACTESFAAVELRRFLARCLARPESEIALLRPDQLPASGNVFVIASGDAAWLTAAAATAGETDFAPQSAESYRVATFAQADRVVTVIKGRDRIGALYGVYGYLDSLGLRFYGLGEQGTVWPESPVTLPAKLDRAESPDYLTRGFWAFENRGTPEFFAWMARNRLNFWTVADGLDHHALKKLGLQLNGGHHNVQFYCINPKGEYPYHHEKFAGSAGKPADPYPISAEFSGDANSDGKLSYFEAHPEWYGLVDGKRSDRILPEFGDNYCTSNPQATRELTQRLIDLCVDGQWREADIINFWMLDLGKWCSCEACQAQGIYSDRLMIVTDAILKAFEEARRDGRLKRRLRLVTLAYHETLAPPTKPLPAGFDLENCAVTFFPIQRCYVHPFADPSCTEINGPMVTDYEGWTKGDGRHYRGSVFIGEYYNVSRFKSLPLLYTRMMAADIPWFYRNGAKHFHYMHTLTARWGTWTLNQYLMGRLLWSTETQVDEVLEEYFTRYYPGTAATMRRFYADLELGFANSKPLKHEVKTPKGWYYFRSRLADPKVELFTLDHFRYDTHRPLLNDGPDLVEMAEALSRARREIDIARMNSTDAVESARIAEDEVRFAYGETMFQFLHHLVQSTILHRQGKIDAARREFRLVEDRARELVDIVDMVQEAGSHGNAKNAFEAHQADKAYEELQKLYGSLGAPKVPERKKRS